MDAITLFYLAGGVFGLFLIGLGVWAIYKLWKWLARPERDVPPGSSMGE